MKEKVTRMDDMMTMFGAIILPAVVVLSVFAIVKNKQKILIQDGNN